MWTSEALFLFVANNSTWIPAFVTWLINKEITRHGWTREKSVFYFFSFIRTFFFAVSSHLLLILCLWWWRSSHYDFDHVIRIFHPFKASHHHFPTYVVIFNSDHEKLLRTVRNVASKSYKLRKRSMVYEWLIGEF